MKRKIFLATNNEGKIERFKNLLNHTDLHLDIYTPKDFELQNINPEENGKTLADNAEIKARAYFGKIDMPILANDTGFWVEGEGLINAPKRKALGENKENKLSKEEIADLLLKFWKGVAKKHGGKVNATWIESFTLLSPDGILLKSESKREVILTDQEFGKAHIQMPIRALYISKITNKPAIEHTAEEEIIEMKPVTDALCKILNK